MKVMRSMNFKRFRFKTGRIASIAFLALVVLCACKSDKKSVKVPSLSKGSVTKEEVNRACGLQCHRMPSADVMPKNRWRKAILTMCEDVLKEGGEVNGVNIQDCIRYYELNAPDTFLVSNVDYRSGLGPIALRKFNMFCDAYPRKSMMGGPAEFVSPGVSNVTWAKLNKNDATPKLIVSDMFNGVVTIFDPGHPKSQAKIIAHIPNPARTTVVDLDKDGILDIVVANMGVFLPSNRELGTIEWLRGKPDGTYEDFTLLHNLARTTDVEFADFDGDGDLDLVATCFGMTQVGEVIYAENKTTDWTHPKFEAWMVDPRPGGIHCPIADLNNDGKPDFVALISQQFETILAFTNIGGGKFKTDTIFQGPHPHFGSSGIQLVDLDGDGDLDVLYTNGDVMDDDILQPYHGIQWLENKGTYPFTYHGITHFNGVESAVAVDLDGDGDLDIVASAYLPKVTLSERKKYDLESVIWLENTGGCNFVRHSIEKFNTGHASIAVADYDGDGRPDIAAGNFCFGPGAYEESPAPIVTIWHNDTKGRPKKPAPKPGVAR